MNKNVVMLCPLFYKSVCSVALEVSLSATLYKFKELDQG